MSPVDLVGVCLVHAISTQAAMYAAGRNSAEKYRADIDGLRAVAVLAVILAHAGMPHVEGGYVGVDVFFVISGFLITRILRSEMLDGSFTVWKFYERRARRILPALLLVIVVCTPLAWVLMLPDFAQNFGQSVVATLLFANNILLAKTSGYWELESEFKPLLHTWSLGVEEQFYFVFPLIMCFLWRHGVRLQVIAIFFVGLASFTLAEYGWRSSPETSFYLPTTRAWELMTGCAAAYLVRRERRYDNLFSLIGFAAILFSVVSYDESTPSPSTYTVLPVLGTVAVILFSRSGTIVYGVLSFPVLVSIGLISYSAYLWHQPVMAFARIFSLEPPGSVVMVMLCLLSLALAWLSWRFVEVPFRSSQVVSRKAFVLPTAALAVVLMAVGLALHVWQGFPKRVFPNIDRTDDVYISYNERIRAFAKSAYPEATKRNVLVMGNSFSRDVANALIEADLLHADDFVYLEDNAGDSLSIEELSGRGDLIKSADIVIISVHSGDAARVIEQVSELKKRSAAKIVVFGPKHFGWNLNPLGRVPLKDRAASRSVVPVDISSLNDELSNRLTGVIYVDLLEMFERNERGVAVFDAEGNPLSPDRVHLTRYGARFLAARLKERSPALVALFD